MADFVELGRYVDRAEAIIMRGVLETNGIVTLTPELYTLAADPGLIFALGGYRVMVPHDQLEAARALLRDVQRANEASPD